MSTLSKVGLVLAVLFVLANVWGIWYAAVHEEPIHTGVHLLLLIPGMYVVWRVGLRRISGG